MRLAPRLRALSAAAATVVLLGAFARDAAADGPMIRVDIYRPENNGLMNLIACIITISGDAKGSVCHQVIRGPASKGISGGKATVLLGGDRVICEINSSNSIQAFTPRSMRPEGTRDSRGWAPTTITPHTKPGQTVELGVVPRARGSTYTGGWLVRQEPRAATEKHAGR